MPKKSNNTAETTGEDLPLATETLVGSELSEPPGHRVPDNLVRLGNPKTRPPGECLYRATLVRGLTYTLSYLVPLVFERGKPVEITQAEFEHLQGACDELTFFDGARRWRRRVRKFSFGAADGGPVDLPDLPDELVGAGTGDPFEDAELAKRQGDPDAASA